MKRIGQKTPNRSKNKQIGQKTCKSVKKLANRSKNFKSVKKLPVFCKLEKNTSEEGGQIGQERLFANMKGLRLTVDLCYIKSLVVKLLTLYFMTSFWHLP